MSWSLSEGLRSVHDYPSTSFRAVASASLISWQILRLNRVFLVLILGVLTLCVALWDLSRHLRVGIEHLLITLHFAFFFHFHEVSVQFYDLFRSDVVLFYRQWLWGELRVLLLMLSWMTRVCWSCCYWVEIVLTSINWASLRCGNKLMLLIF